MEKKLKKESNQLKYVNKYIYIYINNRDQTLEKKIKQKKKQQKNIWYSSKHLIANQFFSPASITRFFFFLLGKLSSLSG